MTGIKFVLTLVLFCGLSCNVHCTTSSTLTSASNSTTTTGIKTTPTTKPVQSSCENTSSCSDCTNSAKCYWCGASDKCKEYPGGIKIPKDCSQNEWYWKQCVLPGYVLIIVVPTVCGVILVSIGCCIYCCCCRTHSSRKYDREDGKFRRRTEEIRQRNTERRAERKLKADSIRKKYGLLKDHDDDDAVA